MRKGQKLDGFSAETADFLGLITTGDELFTTEAVCATVKLLTTDVTDGVDVFGMMSGWYGCAALNSASISRGFVHAE